MSSAVLEPAPYHPLVKRSAIKVPDDGKIVCYAFCKTDLTAMTFEQIAKQLHWCCKRTVTDYISAAVESKLIRRRVRGHYSITGLGVYFGNEWWDDNPERTANHDG